MKNKKKIILSSLPFILVLLLSICLKTNEFTNVFIFPFGLMLSMILYGIIDEKK